MSVKTALSTLDHRKRTKRGLTICKKMFKVNAAKLERHVDLSKYYVTINPQVEVMGGIIYFQLPKYL